MLKHIKVGILSPFAIDLCAAPPGPNQLAKLRTEAAAVKREACLKIDWIKYPSIGFLILLPIVLLATWMMGLINTGDAISIVGAAVMAGLIVMAGIIVIGCDKAVAAGDTDAIAGNIVLAFVIIGAGIGTIAGVTTGSDTEVGSIALAIGITLGIVIGSVIFYFVKQASKAESRLEKLMELNPEDMEDQCIAYDEFRADPVVEAYHRQIADQWRKPVIAEYDAAKAWVKQAGYRAAKEAKRQQAIKACERMGNIS